MAITFVWLVLPATLLCCAGTLPPDWAVLIESLKVFPSLSFDTIDLHHNNLTGA